MNGAQPSSPMPESPALSREDYSGFGEPVDALEDGSGPADEMSKRCAEKGVSQVTAEDIACICLDMKKQVSGRFHPKEFSEVGMPFRNHNCPFGDRVIGRSGLSMIMTNVFGCVVPNTADHVWLHVTEAGHEKRRVALGLKADDGADGHEFFS